MKKVLEALASLKVVVLLLVLLLVGLAAGTITESKMGTDVAQRAVYYAWWFLLLQGVFATSVIASLIQHFPWGKERLGFLTLHASLVVIFLGSAVTYFWKTEGQLGLWEGETGNQIHDPASGVATPHVLPFQVRLIDFKLDRYPGTMRPAMFSSIVEIIDETGTRQERIWMNHPLHYKGYSLFQSSYQQQGDREASVFSVSKDPGQNIVFLGYALLVGGMCLVLFTRAAQVKKKAAMEAALGLGEKAAMILVLGALALPAQALDPAQLEAIRRLPVQHDGRSMPLDTQAREAVWKVSGKYRFEGEDPVATVMRWTFDPQNATQQKIVKLGSSDLALAAGMPGQTHGSFAELVQNRQVIQLMQQARQLGMQDKPRTGVLGDAEKLEERLVAMQDFLNREAIRSIPVANDPVEKWGVATVGAPSELAELAAGPRLPGWPSADAVETELTYMKVRPSQVAWIVLLASLVISILAWNGKSRLLDGLALAGLVLGFGVMAWGIGMRWQVAERIPASNMYESLLWLAAGVGAFAILAFAILRNRLVVLNANAMAAIVMALTDLLPIDRFIHPMPPVLSGTPWLAIHVPIIMVGYSVLALGMLIAHIQVGFTIFAPRRTDLVGRMADLNYWYMMVGNIFLAAGILTGSVWAASSWGRYWGWDPKEVWSLVALLAYMAILHGRFDKFIGQFGVAAISILAFQTILMTYLGVNFVLTTGMHSYGMGDSPVVMWMIIVALAELFYVGAGWLAHRRNGGLDAPAATA
ncbi:MAG: cytochrome c biogenesis protein CcsA [Anaeromyxobacter sp.]